MKTPSLSEPAQLSFAFMEELTAVPKPGVLPSRRSHIAHRPRAKSGWAAAPSRMSAVTTGMPTFVIAGSGDHP